jgi:O-antigen/teichoic acid export membrane protein
MVLARLGLPHLVLSSLSVQGVAYLSQIALAALVQPDEFGIVRSVEACLGLLILGGSLGMPTLTVRMIADSPDPELRGRILGRSLVLAAVATTVGGLIVCVAGMRRGDSLGRYLAALVLVAAIGSASRVCIAYYQGVRQVKDVSFLTAAMALVSLVLLVGPVARWGLAGWALGRYVGELLLLSSLLVSLRRVIRFAGPAPLEPALGHLLRTGSVVAVSLCLRYAVDAAGLLALGAALPATPGLGHFGLGTLAVSALLIVPGGVGTLLLPRMVEARHVPGEAVRLLSSQVLLGLLLTLPLSLFVAAMTPLLLHYFLPAYRGGESIVQTLLFVAPCRALTGAAGNLLLAHSCFRFPLFANSLALATLGSVSLVVARPHGPLAVAWASLGVEAATAAVFLSVAWRVARRGRDERRLVADV